MREPTLSSAGMNEPDLTRRTAGGDHAAFEAPIRQYNRRLFRIARGILKQDPEAEGPAGSLYHRLRRVDMDLATPDVFAFAGERCDRIVAAVLGRLSKDATRVQRL